MASMFKNLGGLFKDTRSRTILLFTGFVLIVAILVGLFTFRQGTEGPETKVSLREVPGNISSVPGSTNPTAQFAKLQREENIKKAQEAQKTGASAIPTIIRVQKFGEGERAKQAGEGGLGFAALTREGFGAQKTLWFSNLKQSNCSAAAFKAAVNQGAELKDLRAACTCKQLKDNGVPLDKLKGICECPALKAAGFRAIEFKNAGYTTSELKVCGFTACELKGAGFTAKQMAEGGFSDGEMSGAGYSPEEIAAAAGLPPGITADMIRKAGCSPEAIRRLRAQGVTAKAIRNISGCSAEQMKAGGFTDAELAAAGYKKAELSSSGCSVAELRAARARGISAKEIREKRGCDASAMRAAGYTAKELKDAGYTAAQLRNAGYSARDLVNAGFTPEQLADAGFNASQLRRAGLSARQLREAGFTPKELQDAGFSPESIKTAGYDEKTLQDAGLLPKPPPPPPTAPVAPPQPAQPAATPKTVAGAPVTDSELQQALARQAAEISAQKLQQEVQLRQSAMQTQANELIGAWQPVTQVYQEGQPPKEKKDDNQANGAGRFSRFAGDNAADKSGAAGFKPPQALVKAGRVVFAVLDTAVNSDEPGPILATVVAGKLKGAKLLGSLTLPPNGKKIIITFNTMTMKDAPSSISINAVAIDPNTARTALSSSTDQHILLRYGSLFASSFLEGIGDAVKSQGTTISAGPNASTTVEEANRSSNENVTVALGKVGQRWGDELGEIFNRPPTVKVYSGTSLGILFTQDVQNPNTQG